LPPSFYGTTGYGHGALCYGYRNVPKALALYFATNNRFSHQRGVSGPGDKEIREQG